MLEELDVNLPFAGRIVEKQTQKRHTGTRYRSELIMGTHQFEATKFTFGVQQIRIMISLQRAKTANKTKKREC